MRKRLCQNADTAFFYAQSPDFLKPGLCYYPKFSYLYDAIVFSDKSTSYVDISDLVELHVTEKSDAKTTKS